MVFLHMVGRPHQVLLLLQGTAAATGLLQYDAPLLQDANAARRRPRPRRRRNAGPRRRASSGSGTESAATTLLPDLHPLVAGALDGGQIRQRRGLRCARRRLRRNLRRQPHPSTRSSASCRGDLRVLLLFTCCHAAIGYNLHHQHIELLLESEEDSIEDWFAQFFGRFLQWKTIALVHHWETRLTPPNKTMLKNGGEKGIELDGLQCLMTRRMQLLRGVVNPIIKEKSNMLPNLLIVTNLTY